MDDTLQELENELKALSPRRPSVELHARLGRELAAPSAAVTAPSPAPARTRHGTATSFAAWKWAGWSMAAAAFLVTRALWRGQSANLAPGPAAADPTRLAATTPAPAPARELYRPVSATNVLYDMSEEAPVSPGDNSAARRMRYRYVDTYTWQSPASHASLKWSVPREEVRVIPASFH